MPDVAVHQALLHDVLCGLQMGGVSVPDLFADEPWYTLRSSAAWLSWQLTLHRHGLPVSMVWATRREGEGGQRANSLHGGAHFSEVWGITGYEGSVAGQQTVLVQHNDSDIHRPNPRILSILPIHPALPTQVRFHQ